MTQGRGRRMSMLTLGLSAAVWAGGYAWWTGARGGVFAMFAVPKAADHIPPPPPSKAGSGPLVRASNLVYEGAFRLPAETIGDSSFAYGGTALGFNPARNSLFVVGHDWQQHVAEIAIPEIRSTTTLRQLATAKVLQPFADPTQGTRGAVGDSTVKVGGLLP